MVNVHVAETLHGRRIVGSPESLDSVEWPEGSIVARFAPDEVLVLGHGDIAVSDPDAIIVDESGFSGFWMARSEAETWVGRNADWEIEDHRLNQGLVASIPVKLFVAGDEVLVIVATALAYELEARL